MRSGTGRHTWRLAILAGLFVLGLFVMSGRVIYIQVIKHDHYVAEAASEHLQKREKLVAEGAAAAAVAAVTSRKVLTSGPAVAILTDSQNPADQKKAQEMGASAYHLKPQRFDELVNLIRRIAEFWLPSGGFGYPEPGVVSHKRLELFL